MASGSALFTKRDGVKVFFKRLSVFNGYEVVIGLPSGTVNDEGVSLVEIGAAHEFGRGVPQRSFLRDTFDLHERKYAKLLAKGTERVIKQNEDPKKTLFVVGETARADVIKRINQGILPENSPATIAAKGSTLPLVDTGALRSSITARVRKGGKDVA